MLDDRPRRRFNPRHALLLTIGCLVTLDCFAVPTQVRDHRLRQRGVEITGTVWSVSETWFQPRGGTKYYHLDYSFDLGGWRYPGRGVISSWNGHPGLSAGAPLAVVYLPEDPDVNAAKAAMEHDDSRRFGLLLLHVLLPAACAFHLLWYRVMRPEDIC